MKTSRIFSESICHSCQHIQYLTGKHDSLYLMCRSLPQRYFPQPRTQCDTYTPSPLVWILWEGGISLFTWIEYTLTLSQDSVLYLYQKQEQENIEDREGTQDQVKPSHISSLNKNFTERSLSWSLHPLSSFQISEIDHSHLFSSIVTPGFSLSYHMEDHKIYWCPFSKRSVSLGWSLMSWRLNDSSISTLPLHLFSHFMLLDELPTLSHLHSKRLHNPQRPLQINADLNIQNIGESKSLIILPYSFRCSF